MPRRLPPTIALAALAACGGGAAHPTFDGGLDAAMLFPRGDRSVALCREVTRPLAFEARPADVMVVFDRSGSMSAEFGTGTRHSVETELLGDLIDAYEIGRASCRE